jgi:hypothetical protein
MAFFQLKPSFGMEDELAPFAPIRRLQLPAGSCFGQNAYDALGAFGGPVCF